MAVWMGWFEGPLTLRTLLTSDSLQSNGEIPVRVQRCWTTLRMAMATLGVLPQHVLLHRGLAVQAIRHCARLLPIGRVLHPPGPPTVPAHTCWDPWPGTGSPAGAEADSVRKTSRGQPAAAVSRGRFAYLPKALARVQWGIESAPPLGTVGDLVCTSLLRRQRQPCPSLAYLGQDTRQIGRRRLNKTQACAIVHSLSKL